MFTQAPRSLCMVAAVLLSSETCEHKRCSTRLLLSHMFVLSPVSCCCSCCCCFFFFFFSLQQRNWHQLRSSCTTTATFCRTGYHTLVRSENERGKNHTQKNRIKIHKINMTTAFMACLFTRFWIHLLIHSFLLTNLLFLRFFWCAATRCFCFAFMLCTAQNTHRSNHWPTLGVHTVRTLHSFATCGTNGGLGLDVKW